MERAARRAARSKGANQAEILRSRQRDDTFVKNLRDNLSEILQKLAGNKTLLHIMQSEVPTKLAYFIVTTGMNNQTIGEEYTGIIQADIDARRVPSLAARVFAILLECFGEQAFLKILDRLLATVDDPRSELTPEAVTLVRSALTRLKTVVPIVIQAHRGLFYILGSYYSLGKRLTGINYVKVYGRRPDEGVNWALRLLGVATLAQCALRLWHLRQQQQLSDDKRHAVATGCARSCQLCLEAVPTTATPCGHLFCWQCISEWLSTRPQCPLCREFAHPSRIIYLLNL